MADICFPPCCVSQTHAIFISAKFSCFPYSCCSSKGVIIFTLSPYSYSLCDKNARHLGWMKRRMNHTLLSIALLLYVSLGQSSWMVCAVRVGTISFLFLAHDIEIQGEPGDQGRQAHGDPPWSHYCCGFLWYSPGNSRWDCHLSSCCQMNQWCIWEWKWLGNWDRKSRRTKTCQVHLHRCCSFVCKVSTFLF